MLSQSWWWWYLGFTLYILTLVVLISGYSLALGELWQCICCWCSPSWVFGCVQRSPDSKVHGANMGPIWGRQDPGGPHVGPMNLAIRVLIFHEEEFHPPGPLQCWEICINADICCDHTTIQPALIEAEWRIYASLNWAIIGSDNGLSPVRRQSIIWTNAAIFLIGPLGTNFSEILIGIQTFSFKKLHLKTLSAKWRLFCLGVSELTNTYNCMYRSVQIGYPYIITH